MLPQWLNTTTTTTFYVGSIEIELVDGVETQRTLYYGAGGAFRVIGGDNAGLYYRHTDHLGSTSLISDSTGAALPNSSVIYAPFGEIRQGTQSGLTDFGYTGQRLDGSTGGLMYYGARYYLPELRRFISPDTLIPNPLDSQAFNRYSYVTNRPMNLVDPSGHSGMDAFCGGRYADAQDCAGNARSYWATAPVIRENIEQTYNVNFFDEAPIQDTNQNGRIDNDDLADNAANDPGRIHNWSVEALAAIQTQLEGWAATVGGTSALNGHLAEASGSSEGVTFYLNKPGRYIGVLNPGDYGEYSGQVEQLTSDYGEGAAAICVPGLCGVFMAMDVQSTWANPLGVTSGIDTTYEHTAVMVGHELAHILEEVAPYTGWNEFPAQVMGLWLALGQPTDQWEDIENAANDHAYSYAVEAGLNYTPGNIADVCGWLGNLGGGCD